MANKTTAVERGIFDFQSVKSVNGITKISILSVLAYIIMFFETPILFFPGFLQLDLSDLPALLGGLTLGPAAGIMIELIKNILHFVTKTTTGGVGEFANFLVGVALILPASIIYAKHKTKKAAVIGMALGVLVMMITSAVANYYILLPFYAKVMPLDKIIAMSAAANAAIVDIKTLILYAVIPFNFLKGTIIAVLASLLYKKLSPILKIR